MILAAAAEEPSQILDVLDVTVGGASMVLAAVAIFVALRAQQSADTAITDERRRIFELEVLRDLMKDLDETPVASEAFRQPKNTLGRYQLRLDLLSSRLPSWDRVMELTGMEPVIDEVGLGSEYLAQKEKHRQLNEKRAKAVEASILAQEAAMWPDEKDGLSRAERGLAWGSAQRTVEALHEEEQKAGAEMSRIEQEARLKLAEKLAYDVRQAIWARVEARRKWPMKWINKNL